MLPSLRAMITLAHGSAQGQYKPVQHTTMVDLAHRATTRVSHVDGVHWAVLLQPPAPRHRMLARSCSRALLLGSDTVCREGKASAAVALERPAAQQPICRV